MLAADSTWCLKLLRGYFVWHYLTKTTRGYLWKLHRWWSFVAKLWFDLQEIAQWINAKVNRRTALDRSTVQVFNGSTPRSMDAQLSLYSSTTPRRNTDLSQWPEDFDTRQQQTRTGNIPIANSHTRVVKAPMLKLRPFISLVLSVPRDKYLEGRLFLLNSSHCKAI